MGKVHKSLGGVHLYRVGWLGGETVVGGHQVCEGGLPSTRVHECTTPTPPNAPQGEITAKELKAEAE